MNKKKLVLRSIKQNIWAVISVILFVIYLAYSIYNYSSIAMWTRIIVSILMILFSIFAIIAEYYGWANNGKKATAFWVIGVVMAMIGFIIIIFSFFFTT